LPTGFLVKTRIPIFFSDTHAAFLEKRSLISKHLLMKPLTLITFVCALGTAGFAQTQSDSSKTVSITKKWTHELTMNLYSSSVRSGNFYNNYKTVYDHYAVSGLSLKFFHGKSAIRSSVDYFQKITVERARSFLNQPLSFKSLQFATGYQRYFGNKKVMPYVFTDLSYSYGKELIRGNNYGPLEYVYSIAYVPYYYNPVTVRTSAFSASPGLGLRLSLRKNMILNLETAAELFYMKQFGTYTFGTANEITGINLKLLKCSFGFIL
jgi:hypothetical protein